MATHVPLGVLRGRGGGDFGFDRGVTILVLNPGAIQRMNLPGGEVYTWTRNMGLEIVEVAKGRLFVGHGYKTGELQRSISSSVTPTLHSVALNVRATAKHAVYYHEGVRPHPIRARNFRYMKFFWERVGHIVYFKEVIGARYGYNSDPFLREAMNEVLTLKGVTL